MKKYYDLTNVSKWILIVSVLTFVLAISLSGCARRVTLHGQKYHLTKKGPQTPEQKKIIDKTEFINNRMVPVTEIW